MRALGIAVAALVFGLAGPAWSGVKMSVRTETYSIVGQNGHALLKSMNKRGPKHGFLARAMAQTSYTVDWKVSWEKRGSACKVKQADAQLSIRYRYPKVSGRVPTELAARWKRFMVGVRAHEEMHGKIAKDMVAAAQKSIMGMTVGNDPNCAKAKATAGRRIDAIYATYVARQQVFDRKEHRGGGNVDGLITALIR